MSQLSTPPPDRSISESDWALTPKRARAYVAKLVEKSKRATHGIHRNRPPKTAPARTEPVGLEGVGDNSKWGNK